MDRIDDTLYSRFVELMPIACIDVVIHEGDYFVMVKRNEEPAKGLWWIPGGRLLKDETMEEGAVRKAKEETGLDVEVERRIGVYDEFFDTSIQGCPTHTVCVAFLVKSKSNLEDTVTDCTSDCFKIVDHIDGDTNPYVSRVIKDSGILERK